MPIGSKNAKSNKSNNAIFRTYSNGIKTHRDSWAYNSSKKELSKNMKRHIDYCIKHGPEKPIDLDKTQAQWSSGLTALLKKLTPKFDKNQIRVALYRPFFKQYLYYDKIFSEARYRIPSLFPENNSKNRAIIVPDKFTGEFSTFVTDITPDLEIIHHGQCFPLYTYENKRDKKFNISDSALHEYQNHYINKKITKEHIFEYVYSMLHHPEYRKKFANNLIRELPHIPMAPDFWAFRNVGKDLIDLHLNYETGTKYDLGKPKIMPKKFTKLVFGSKTIDGKRKKDTSIICDGKMPIFDNLPEIKYQVNGGTPMEWVVDRYNYSVDKDSGIVNNPLDAITGRDVIDLIRRLVHVGVQSDKLVKSLPAEFEPKNWEPKKTGLDEYTNGNTPSQSTH